MKTKILFLLLFASFQLATAQTAKVASKPAAVKFDGVYECKEWKFIDDKIDNPEPAYYRFYPDGTLLFCHYVNPKDKDSVTNALDIFRSALSEDILNKIKDNVADDPTRVSKESGKFVVTAYKYQKITGGICFDILSERPNCLGKPNLKVISNVLIKTDNGNPADDRYYKFIQVN